MVTEMSKGGKRGIVVIPASLRRRFGLIEGSPIIVEERAEGILIRPVAVVPIEIYTPDRRAEFLLSDAADAEDYARAREEVLKLGLEPDRVPHHKPAGA